MRKVDLTGSLFEVELEPEEVSNSLNTLLDALETKDVHAMILQNAYLDQSCAVRLSQAFENLPGLQILNLDTAGLADYTV